MKHTSPHDTATLLVFCKQPKLGQGKQRLAATLGKDVAFEIASALLACALEDAAKWPGPVVLSPADSTEEEWARNLLCHAEVVAQPQGNLGHRIMSVDQQLRDKGHQTIMIIGTDAPMLNEAVFSQALDGLTHSDVTLSAAEDGGVTLMGSRIHWPNIVDIPWSTDRLGESLHYKCVQAGRSISYTQPSYDIDHEKDLHKLIVDLEHDLRPARQALFTLVKSVVYNSTIKVTS